MKKNRRYRFYFITNVIFTTIFVGLFMVGIMSLVSGDLFGPNANTLGTTLLASSIPFAVIASYSFKSMIDQRGFVSRLEIENSYTLGKKVPFYNFDAFKTYAGYEMKKKDAANVNSYLIAFSTGNISVSANTFHNDMVMRLNYFTSEYLTTLYNDRRGKFSGRNTIYGFNRGIFLILLKTKQKSDVPDLVSMISSNVFKIVSDNKLRVMVQPFFGVKELEEEENIVSAIEDAMIARSVSESNFETYTFFNSSFKKESTNQDINELEEALNNGEFVVFYQPKYSIRSHSFISAEALARWDSPKYGLLSPAAFIDKAETAGLISALDNYIFEKALIDLSEGLKRGRRVLPVSINFSLYEFYSNKFLDNVVSLLEKYRVPPSLIEIEITETTSQANQFLSISVIKKLKDIGIRVLMDDFGVGYSGIGNLRNIPFDAIKIDKSFTDLIVTDDKSRSIVKLLADLGHLNDIEVIVEGVDNKEQVDILKKIKVDTIQGFYYAKPMSSKDYEIFLKTNAFEKEKKEQ